MKPAAQTTYVGIVLSAICFGWPAASNGQPSDYREILGCEAEDRICIETRYIDIELSYLTDCTDSLVSCRASIARLEADSMAASLTMRLIAGVLYYRFARVAGGADSEEAQRARQQSDAALRDVLARQATGYYAGLAYLGLANLAEIEEVQEQLLRAAVAADPEDVFVPELLAGRLSRRNEQASLAEAVEFMRHAYTLRTRRDPEGTDLKRWHVGTSVVGLYNRSGQPDEAAEFREQLRRDSRMDALAEEVPLARFADDPQYAEQSLRTACWRYIVAMFGADTCRNGIDTLVRAVDSGAPDEHRLRLADVATEGMTDLVIAQEEEYRGTFVPILRRWIDNDIHTASVFLRYSNQVADAELSLWALENAVELEPDNGQYRYWLGSRYLDAGRFEEALEQLHRARPDLPEGFSVEFLDTRIQRAEAGRATGQPR